MWRTKPTGRPFLELRNALSKINGFSLDCRAFIVLEVTWIFSVEKKLNISSPFLSLLPLIRRNDVVNILNFSDDHFQVKLVPFIHSCHEIPPVLKRENQETC